MKLELLSASNFLVHLVRLSRRNVPESQLAKFHENLVEVLRRRYRDHWFPERPFKGSGFRCIRINGKFDPLIGQAGEACGLSAKFLHSIFPSELTLWVDPLEVSYRIGENGSICVLYEHKDGVTEPWRPTIQQPNQTSANNKSSSSSVTSSQNNNKNNSSHHHHHHHNNSHHSQQQQQQQQLTSPSCKESIRNMDYILDRKSVSIEQLAAFVSS